MDKSRVCVSRTINLAKSKRPSKANLLAYETSDCNQPSCTIPTGRPPLSKPPVKRIRLCTGAQLKRVCRPPPCPLPRRKSSITIGDLVAFCVKSLFVASLIYYSWEAGMWGDSEESEMFYTNFCHMFGDVNKKEFKLKDACEAEMEFRATPPEGEDKCKRPPIDSAQLLYKMKQMWNHAVSCVFEGLVGFPGNLSKMFPPKADDCPKK